MLGEQEFYLEQREGPSDWNLPDFWNLEKKVLGFGKEAKPGERGQKKISLLDLRRMCTSFPLPCSAWDIQSCWKSMGRIDFCGLAGN
jgi:hypothetical protein